MYRWIATGIVAIVTAVGARGGAARAACPPVLAVAAAPASAPSRRAQVFTVTESLYRMPRWLAAQ